MHSTAATSMDDACDELTRYTSKYDGRSSTCSYDTKYDVPAVCLSNALLQNDRALLFLLTHSPSQSPLWYLFYCVIVYYVSLRTTPWTWRLGLGALVMHASCRQWLGRKQLNRPAPAN